MFNFVILIKRHSINAMSSKQSVRFSQYYLLLKWWQEREKSARDQLRESKSRSKSCKTFQGGALGGWQGEEESREFLTESMGRSEISSITFWTWLSEMWECILNTLRERLWLQWTWSTPWKGTEEAYTAMVSELDSDPIYINKIKSFLWLWRLCSLASSYKFYMHCNK